MKTLAMPSDVVTPGEVVHVFEVAGLGKAPFRLVAVVDGKLNGCQYCGTGIKIHCIVEGADGKRFRVGTDCVAKVGGEGLRRVVDAAVRDRAREKRHAKAMERRTLLRATLAREDVRAALSAQPHPLEWRREKGDTRLDWAEWMLGHAGDTGCQDVLAFVAKAGF